MDDYAQRLASGGYYPEDDSFEAQLIREKIQWEISLVEHEIRRYRKVEEENKKKARERYLWTKKQKKQQQQNGEQPSAALLAKKLNGGR